MQNPCVPVTNETLFRAAALNRLENFSSRSMNIALANAAQRHQKSPRLRGFKASDDKSTVPEKANKADVKVDAEIDLPRSRYAKNGTNLTFKYRRNALLDAVVVSRPIA